MENITLIIYLLHADLGKNSPAPQSSMLRQHSGCSARAALSGLRGAPFRPAALSSKRTGISQPACESRSRGTLRTTHRRNPKSRPARHARAALHHQLQPKLGPAKLSDILTSYGRETIIPCGLMRQSVGVSISGRRSTPLRRYSHVPHDMQFRAPCLPGQFGAVERACSDPGVQGPADQVPRPLQVQFEALADIRCARVCVHFRRAASLL
jgi:hypothetical protein